MLNCLGLWRKQTKLSKVYSLVNGNVPTPVFWSYTIFATFYKSTVVSKLTLKWQILHLNQGPFAFEIQIIHCFAFLDSLTSKKMISAPLSF